MNYRAKQASPALASRQEVYIIPAEDRMHTEGGARPQCSAFPSDYTGSYFVVMKLWRMHSNHLHIIITGLGYS